MCLGASLIVAIRVVCFVINQDKYVIGCLIRYKDMRKGFTILRTSLVQPKSYIGYEEYMVILT